MVQDTGRRKRLVASTFCTVEEIMRSVPLLIIFTWRCGAFRPAPLRRICESSTGRDIVVGHEVRGGGERCKWSIITRTEPLSVTKDAEQMTDRGGVSVSTDFLFLFYLAPDSLRVS